MLKKNVLRVALLTGGTDTHYNLGLLGALVEEGLNIDFIGNDEMMDSEATKQAGVTPLNLRGDTRPDASLTEKVVRILEYYKKLIVYASRSDARIFHIIWLNKFHFFDRTFLNLYYKLLGKKLVFTAHNVNAGERDGTDSFMNRASLRFMYRVTDHIFVHTDKMRQLLVDEYRVNSKKVTVIRYGYNKVVLQTDMTKEAARRQLGLEDKEKVLLFFGNIAPYKGVEYLISAMALLKERMPGLRLIIAGRVKDCEEYWHGIRDLIDDTGLRQRVLLHVRHIPDDEVEVFYKAADATILSHKRIFTSESGGHLLSFQFGVPCIVSDVGSLREEIIEGQTGFVCSPEDPEDLAKKIELYFTSNLYTNLEANRENLMNYVRTNNSWEKVAETTNRVYQGLL